MLWHLEGVKHSLGKQEVSLTCPQHLNDRRNVTVAMAQSHRAPEKA
jgi:hypothetical protein